MGCRAADRAARDRHPRVLS